MVPMHFWRIAIVRGVLPSRESGIKGAIVNKLFTVENRYHNINETYKAREQKRRGEAAVIGKQKRKYRRGGEESLTWERGEEKSLWPLQILIF